MADTPSKRTTTVCGTGTIIVRQRPTFMLLKLTLRATEPTLELGFAHLKKQREQVEKWLRGLNATQVDFGEPHFADQDGSDPMKRRAMRMTSALTRRKGADAKEEAKAQELNVVTTALWPIDTLSAEQVLIQVDRLRFETAESGPPVEAEESPPWASPEERFQEIVARAVEPFVETGKPLILFSTKLSEERLNDATLRATAQARQAAERLAAAFGKPLGVPTYINANGGRMASIRADRMMARQRCEGLLSGTSYDLGEDEVVSEDPRSVEFNLSVSMNFELGDGTG